MEQNEYYAISTLIYNFMNLGKFDHSSSYLEIIQNFDTSILEDFLNKLSKGKINPDLFICFYFRVMVGDLPSISHIKNFYFYRIYEIIMTSSKNSGLPKIM